MESSHKNGSRKLGWASLDGSTIETKGYVRFERASGGRWDRPELHRLLDQLRPRDVVVVWKLNRLSRSLKALLHLMERIAHDNAAVNRIGT